MKSFFLIKAISFSGSCSFYWKSFLLVEIALFCGDLSLSWWPFNLFIKTHFILLALVVAVPFSAGLSF